MEGVLFSSVLSIVTLLSVATFISYVMRRSNFPYPVVLVIVGVILGYIANNSELLFFLKDFSFSSELVFYVFLPTLIFESAFHINFRQFRQNLQTITWLSTFGVIANMFLIGAGMHYLLDWGWAVSLLFGALISPTDPISVLALFKRLGVSPRLSTIVEGESLVNDGMALVLFGIMIDIVLLGDKAVINGWNILGNLSSNIIGGLIVGVLLGYLFSKILDYVKESKEIEISVTLILAHSTFIIAEYFFGVSGILATMAAGIVVGNYGIYKVSPTVKDVMIHFWDYMSFVANSLLFLLVGLIIWDFDFGISSIYKEILIVIGIVLVARAVIVYTILPLINMFAPSEKINFSWMHIIQWSGLRGALVLALILTLSTGTPYYDKILIYSIAVIFFTLIVNGISIEWLISAFGLKNFTIIDNFLYEESKLLIDDRVACKLNKMHKKGFVNDEVYEHLLYVFESDIAERRVQIKELILEHKKELSATQMKEILKRHLLSIEKRVYLELYNKGELTQDVLYVLDQNVDFQIENKPEVRTALGKLLLVTHDSLLIKILTKLGFVGLCKKLKAKEIMLRYEMYRARVISSTEVLDSLKTLAGADIFENNHIKYFAEKYEFWNKNAVSKLEKLNLKGDNSFYAIEIYLAKRATYKVERRSIEEFYANGFFDQKVYNRLLNELDQRYAHESIH